jgi:hypothetical protein
MPLMPSLKPTFSSVAIFVVRKRTSPEASAVQLSHCVTTSPVLQRRLTVTAPDLQLPSQAPSLLEDERSFQRPYSFVFPGMIGTLVAINITSAVLSLMV